MRFTDPNDYAGSDSRRIQAAIDDAAARGLGRTVISRRREAPAEPWIITETLYLPSDFTLVVDNCTLRLGDGVFCNLIANRNAYAPEGRTAAGRQHNIVLEGRGRATLSGGAYNGLSERSAGRDGRPPIWVNCLVFFANAEGITVRDLRLERARWWAVCFIHCARGQVRGLHFESDRTRADGNGVVLPGIPEGCDYGQIRVKNADGVDLRAGCHDFLIEDLSGFTEDDTVALTALPARSGNLEDAFRLEGACADIQNVTVRNVRARSVCSLVRLLNQGGVRLRGVAVSGVADTWTPGCGLCRSAFTVRLGDAHPYGGRAALPEETEDITIGNVSSAAARAGVMLSGGMRRILVKNVRLAGAGPNAVAVRADEAAGEDVRTE